MKIQNIRYAYDTVLLASSSADLENLLTCLKEESEFRGLKINKKKTKLMKIKIILKKQDTVKCKITFDDEELQQVESFNYLESILAQECRGSSDIKTRIALAK